PSATAETAARFHAGTPDATARVLDFWLNEIGPDGWFESDPGIDRACATRLGALAELAADRQLMDWVSRPHGALALLVLLDQMPRNIHRGTARAFASDTLALSVAVQAIGRGFDLALPEPGRLLFYLPLSHTETLAAQDRCVRLTATRLPLDKDQGGGALEHAIKHREVIRRFGRFPSRNACLGRADTAAEIAYRQAGGYMS
ncbi:MAG: DUF924 family protein, partial [Pseudomonadota bacterium]